MNPNQGLIVGFFSSVISGYIPGFRGGFSYHVPVVCHRFGYGMGWVNTKELQIGLYSMYSNMMMTTMIIVATFLGIVPVTSNYRVLR